MNTENASTPITPPPDPESRLASLEAELAQARASLAASEQARSIQTSLADSGAIDLDAASLLVSQSLGGGKGSGATGDRPAPSIDQAVRDLKRRKPHLFAGAPSPAVGSMGAGVRPRPTDNIQSLAQSAAATGDRRSLLRYLRARRSA